MLKLLIVVSLFFKFYSREVQGLTYHHNGMFKQASLTCKQDSDCLKGYFCKNNDCVAKRAEGSQCMSGRDEECICGKCALNPLTWERVCQLDEDKFTCLNEGVTKHNTCEFDRECPVGHFCDHQDGKVCKSLLASGRLCSHDGMCLCGKCSQIAYKPMPARPPIIYSVCAEC